jgi:hypothetical protein
LGLGLGGLEKRFKRHGHRDKSCEIVLFSGRRPWQPMTAWMAASLARLAKTRRDEVNRWVFGGGC